MQYLGGKTRIAKDIAHIISQYSQDKTFVSLFCGAISVESNVIAKEYILNDYHPYLIETLKAFQSNWLPPENISKEEYYRIKNNPDEDKKLTGFVGFACSFGGKWFGGYASNKREDNYAKQGKNGLLKLIRPLYNAKFYNLDYRLVSIPDNSVVYCDPPYQNTTRYSNSSEFNHPEFWEYMRELSKSNIVFISEVSAPDDFNVIWEKDLNRQLNKNDNFKSSEKLFVFNKTSHN